MLLKILLKIWPALTPLALYVLWVIIFELIILKRLKKQKDYIEAEFEEVDKNGKAKSQVKSKVGHFSLKNPRFIVIIYLSLILMIISFLFFAIQVPKIQKGQYVPSQFKDGKIIPAQIENE